MAPGLPPHFVPRPEITASLKRSLFQAVEQPGLVVAGAIHGLGGLGKSTLAAHLAHDPEVRSRFPDGVLWATLGQEPEPAELLGGWIRELGDFEFGVRGVDAAAAHLRTLLRGRAILLVVDDAWGADHLRPFMLVPHPCRVLVTTRQVHIARAVNAELFQLDLMSPAQARELVGRRLGRPVDAAEEKLVDAVAREVGYLPLALELVSAQVADGEAWEGVLNALRTEVERLEQIRAPGRLEEYGNRIEDLKDFSLLASFTLSLRKLPSAQLRQFVWLGVVPEDAELTAAPAATVWQVEPAEAERTLRDFRNRSLLLEGLGSGGAPRYRLHDLIHATARRLLTTNGADEWLGGLCGLGISLPVAHATLLDSYARRLDRGMWHTVPNDGYIHTHLTWHMARSARPELIHSLLAEPDVDGGHGWFRARERHGQVAGFLSDLRRAEETISDDDEPAAVNFRKRLRYDLIRGSLASVAARVPHELVAGLLGAGLWSPEQGLSYARQVADPERRALALTAVLPAFPALERVVIEREAIAAINVLKPAAQAERLDALASNGGGEATRQACDRLAHTSLAGDGLRDAVELALRVLPHCSPALVDLLWQRASRGGNLVTDLWSLRQGEWHNLARRLGPANRDALVRSMLAELANPGPAFSSPSATDREGVARLLLPLLPLVSGPLRTKVLRKIGRCLRRPRIVADAFAVYPPMLGCWSGPEQVAVSRDLFALAMNRGRPGDRVDALARLCGTVPDDAGLRPRIVASALAVVSEIKGRDERNRALSTLAVHIPSFASWPHKEEALAAIRATGTARERVVMLTRVAARLPLEERRALLTEALQLAQLVDDWGGRAAAYTSLIPLVTPGRREAVSRAALEAIQASEPFTPIRALRLFRRVVRGRQMGPLQAVAEGTARSFSNHGARAVAFAALAEGAAEEDRERLVRAAYRALGRTSAQAFFNGTLKLPRRELPNRFQALAAIARMLPDDLLQHALDQTARIKYSGGLNSRSQGQCEWLRALASGGLGRPVWEQAVRLARQIPDFHSAYDSDLPPDLNRSEALGFIVARCPGSCLTRATRMARSLPSAGGALGLLLIRRLHRTPAADRAPVVLELIDWLARRQFGRGVDPVRRRLSRILTPDLQGQVVELLLQRPSSKSRGSQLAQLAPLLENDLRSVLLTQADWPREDQPRPLQAAARDDSPRSEAPRAEEVAKDQSRQSLLKNLAKRIETTDESEIRSLADAAFDCIGECVGWWP